MSRIRHERVFFPKRFRELEVVSCLNFMSWKLAPPSGRLLTVLTLFSFPQPSRSVSVNRNYRDAAKEHYQGEQQS
jgi:hypothetical protein